MGRIIRRPVSRMPAGNQVERQSPVIGQAGRASLAARSLTLTAVGRGSLVPDAELNLEEEERCISGMHAASGDLVNSFHLFHDRCCLLIDKIMVIYIQKLNSISFDPIDDDIGIDVRTSGKSQLMAFRSADRWIIQDLADFLEKTFLQCPVLSCEPQELSIEFRRGFIFHVAYSRFFR